MIKITENSLRDGHQSLLATRMRTEDMLEAAQIFEKIGFWSVEVWGGATYDTCLRYLKEDPFERLAQLKEIFKKTPMQMLLRGQNLVGYRHYADDVVKEFVRLCVRGGVGIFRVFDALNDIRNVETAVEAVKNGGAHAQGAICYTTSPIHTIKGFVEYAKELKKRGCDSIAVKDMAGLISPHAAFELVSALKNEVDLPLSFHTHCTAGFAFGAHLRAVEAGADVLDLSNSALAEGTSHPCTQSMVATLADDPKHATGLDLALMEKAAEILRRARRKYKKFESEYNSVDTRVLVSQIPGGMISNLANQLREQNALERMEEVLEEIPNVRKDFGYPPLVTPSSQIVGTQAVLNVLSQTRYKSLTIESKNVLRGFYGKTPAPVNAELLARIKEEGEEIIECRPADLLKNELEAAKAESADFAKSETDVISFAMFGGIAKKFLQERNSGKLEPEPLTSFDGDNAPIAKEFTINLHGESYQIKVEGSGSKKDAVRPFFVRVNGDLKEVLLEQSASSAESNVPLKSGSLPVASAPGHIISPMPGNLTKLRVKVGDSVKEGDVLAIVEAMKMENQVLATVGGEVKEIYANEGQQIAANLAIMLVE